MNYAEDVRRDSFQKLNKTKSGRQLSVFPSTCNEASERHERKLITVNTRINLFKSSVLLRVSLLICFTRSAKAHRAQLFFGLS